MELALCNLEDEIKSRRKDLKTEKELEDSKWRFFSDKDM